MSSAAKPTARPLSPHLQVYRLPLTALLSISHRITGGGLAVGLVGLAYWLTAAAVGADAYAQFQGIASSWFGQLVLFGFSFALYFHLCNGIRHLFWDAGKGFKIADAQRSDKMVLAGAIVLTAITWLVA
ncbi:MAG: succinate dehydrogenase, cytochrome b556 subunit [Alphaproteobacteria bacterium]|nr:succinate dehydrogenase, cytochrome b556 subunit [Alphaproteobacteria bacterium]